MTDVLLKPAMEVRHKWPANMAEQDTGEFKEEASYKTYDTWLKEFGRASVSPESVIYKNGLVYPDSLVAKEDKSYYQFRHLIKKTFFNKNIRLDGNKRYLLVTDKWSPGHFHWFGEVLPKLLCIKERTKEFVLLLQDTSYTRTIGLESLALLKLNFEDILFMQEQAFYKVKNLYYISKISRSGHHHPELMKELQQKFIAGRQKGNRRLYISRQKAKYRRVVNEEALWEKLKAYGFEVVYGEDFSLSEQADIFSSAGTLLGIHGAGLTNAVFMYPGSNIIELRRKEGGATNVGFWHIADSMDEKYYYYNGVPDSDKPLVGNGCNLTIPVEDFEKRVLEKI